jgi:hypothetical protein
MKLSIDELLLIDFINCLDPQEALLLCMDQSDPMIVNKFPFLQKHFLCEFYYHKSDYNQIHGHHPILLILYADGLLEKIYKQLQEPSLSSKKKMLKVDSSLIKLIENPSKSVITLALMSSGNNICYINNQSDYFVIMALNETSTAIMGIKTITDKIFNFFITTEDFIINPDYFVENFITEQTELTPLMLLKLIPFVNQQTVELIKTHKNWKSIAQLVLDKIQ